VKRSRVAVAVGALGAAVVLGLSLLPSSGGAAAALPKLVSTNPVDYTPNIVGSECFTGTDPTLCRRVNDMTRIGNTVWAGGTIGTVRNPNGSSAGTYGNALSFDALTGAVNTAFKPIFTGASNAIHDGPVNAVERSSGGTAVWFGGEFKKVNGVAARGLVRWDVATNSLSTAFRPNIGADLKTSKVYDVKYFCGRLWVAGDFTNAGGVNRTALVSLDPTTGAATNHVNLRIAGTATAAAGPTRVYKIAPSPNCKRVVITGNFTTVNGIERYQIAMLNVSDTGVASLAPWYGLTYFRASHPGFGAKPCTSQPAWTRDVDWAPDGTWWALVGAGGGTGGFPALCDSVSRWTNNDNTHAVPVWVNYSQVDSFLSVRVTGAHVYVGGHFRALDAAVYRNGTKVYSGPAHEHYGLGVLNATFTSGMSIAGWNDGATTGRGAGWGGMLVSTGDSRHAAGLWVGGDSGLISGENGRRLALLPLI
jgi:hypothetical protein